MKRYRLDADGALFLHPEGEIVWYDEMKDMICINPIVDVVEIGKPVSAKDFIQTKACEIKPKDEFFTLKIVDEPFECNCVDEMRKARVKRASWSLDVPYCPAWICPAHGYKRL